MSHLLIKEALRAKASRKKAAVLQRFFKTGPGDYGAGDRFLGVVVPEIRKIAKRYINTGRADITACLVSPFHEERLVALIILVLRFEQAGEDGKKEIYDIYLHHTRFINNWDLVDLTAPQIVGGYLLDKVRDRLYDLARSPLIWERRIAILATFRFIRNGEFDDTLRIAAMLLGDREDLIHKAVGWMLREVGKRDRAREEQFLKRHHAAIPRTMLRYAIERFPETKRQAYLHKRT